MPSLTPFLWMHSHAEEAVSFYQSVFPDSTVNRSMKNGDKTMLVHFEVLGQELIILNGGPTYTLTPAFSLVVNCDTQTEIDYYWDKLVEGGGKHVQCGWLQDRFGVSWQVVPSTIGELMTHSDPAARGRVMGALMQMTKIEIEALVQAAK